VSPTGPSFRDESQELQQLCGVLHIDDEEEGRAVQQLVVVFTSSKTLDGQTVVYHAA
jgi:hypothetical protein